MGDWNAVVGKEKVNNVTGAFGLERRNERGERLLEFCAKHNSIITNSCFDPHQRRRYTWKMPGDINKYQIDYIYHERRSYPGADIDSDHNLVMMKCELKLKIITDKKKEIVQWKIKNLRDGKISKKYNECTMNLKDKIKLSATKTLGNSNNTARKE
ncbi:Uncharacterized protein FWK35_00019758 [Aphis craccivora]|uniref:Craniofacial development protein 2-like n=1 Tax=Aphis craccivora TaxID=307492 RepID=A0A6G0WSR8_APHCR|nr:Uncharacterized protein FWK35_00019758 [Aphis craccivora]